MTCILCKHVWKMVEDRSTLSNSCSWAGSNSRSLLRWGALVALGEIPWSASLIVKSFITSLTYMWDKQSHYHYNWSLPNYNVTIWVADFKFTFNVKSESPQNIIRFVMFSSKRGYYYILVHTMKRNQHNLVPPKDSTNTWCHGKLMGTPIFVYKKVASIN